MTDLNVGKFGKKGVDLSNFNGGLKKENLKTEEQKSIFNAIDSDKNGVIDEKEMQDFKSKLDKSEDNHVSRREARKFLKENDLKGLSKKEVLKFLQEYAVNTENVKSAQVVDEDGKKTVHLEYEDGTQEVINPDQSSRVSQTDENGTSTTRYLDANKKLQKDTVSTPEGVTTETEYAEDGSTPTLKTITDNANGSVSTVVYEEGKPSEKELKQGSTTRNYTFDDQGNEVLNSKVENQGIPAKEKRTDYTYNEDGTVTANIKQEGKETVQQLKDGKVQSEVITEEGKTTTIEHAEDGSRTETVQEENGSSSVTQFNAEGKKLKQTKTVNGTTYEVEYDGNGNTKVVLQNGESIEALAKKFGTTKQEIIEANGGKVRGWAGDDIVVPGEIDADAKALQNRDSKEVAQAKYKAFAEEVQRQKEEAQAGLEARKDHHFTWTEKKFDTYEKLARALFKREGNDKPNKYEMQSRIDELKKLNPNVKDGELIGKRIKVSVSEGVADGINGRQIARERGQQIQKQKQETKTGSALAQNMHNAIHGHAGGVSEKEFKDALAKVNKNNVLGVVEGYNKLSPDESLLEAIMDETGNTLETRRNAVSKIVNSLIERAKTAGVKDDRTKQMLDDCTKELESYWSMGIGYCSTEKLDGLVKNVVGAIHVSEAMTHTEKVLASKDNAIDDTLNIMQANVDENRAKLQKQLDEDGWCADLYEGLKWCVGSDNLDENVKADLKEFEDSIAELSAARAKGGDAAFKAKFKEIFDVEYSPEMTQGYRKLQSNFVNAQALTLQLDGYNKEFASSMQGKESYDVMLNKFGAYMQNVSSDVQDGKTVVEQSLAVAMQKDGIDFSKASEAQKTQYLQKLIKDTQSGISKQITEYTGGKDLATLESELQSATSSIFGNKKDLVNRVNSYISSQQVGGAVVNGAIKAVGAIAIAVVTGGTGLVALGVAAAGTAAFSAATDLTDRASSNVGLKDGEVTNILKNATIDGATVFVGGQVTKAAMAFKSSKAFVQAGGRMLSQAAGDVAVGAGAEYMQTGEITLQGVTFQAVFSAAGNLVALKQLAKGSHTPSGTTAPKKTLDVATSDGAKMPGGKLGAGKMNQVKNEIAEELPGATPERGAQIHQEGDKLQAQSRSQGRDVKHMVEDEFGVVTIGKEHIDISTADASTIERLHKEVSGWSTDTRNKAEILKRIEDRMVELHVSPDAPNVTRGSEFVDRINTNAQQNASDILAGKKGALPPHDAAVLKEHLTNNLNTVEDVENFMDALKKRVGVDEKGNMHKYEVQGVDQAADVMKSAEAKLAKMKARQADVAATNSAADAAINGSRGLNEQEFATIKSFVDRTDSAEDLQALIKKFENNKCLRNSQASKKLLKTMQDKVEVLQAKSTAPKVVAEEPQGVVKPQETYVDPHHIQLDRAPETVVPEGGTFDDFVSVQRKLASERPVASEKPSVQEQSVVPESADIHQKPQETYLDPHHIELDRAPEVVAQDGNAVDFMAAHQQLQQKTHDDLVSMLNDKARTGKGLNQAEIKQVNDYISTITDEAQLKELKGLLAGKKMTSVQKKQLKEAIANKEKSLNSVANPEVETPAAKPKDNVETPKVSKESIDADVKSISDSEIPSAQRKLWADCKQRISDITDKLSTSFKGNKAAMVAKCKVLFADLKTIAANASASVKVKIQGLMKKLRTMMAENNVIKNKVDDIPVKTTDINPANVNTPAHQKYVLTPEQREQVYNLYDSFHEELQDVGYLRQNYPQYSHLSDEQLLNEFKLDETHAAFVKNRKDLFANGVSKYSERPYWSDSPYELTNDHCAWKMHLFSVSEMDYQQMAEVVLPYLNKNKIAHKTLSSTVSPELLCKTAPKQAGKAFTIYPQSPQEMEKIARDLDKLIKEHNLQTTNSKITGDNQLGNSGRLFYRYELPSGSMKDHIYKPGEHIPYEANRGEGKYLASDMTPADDPWLNFDPSNPNSKPNISKAASVQPEAVAYRDFTNVPAGAPLPKNEPVYLYGNERLSLADYTVDLNSDDVQSILTKMKNGDVITVGRDGDIKVNDSYTNVSRKHLTIEKTEDGFLVKDISKNGTKIAKKGFAHSENRVISESPVYKDYTKANVGTSLPKDEGVLLSGTERLNLANTTLDLNSPQVQSVLGKMKKGDRITVGREGDIKINDSTRAVSRKHLTIEKTDNGFIVKDTSKNGTTIAAKQPVGSANPNIVLNDVPQTYNFENVLLAKSRMGASGEFDIPISWKKDVTRTVKPEGSSRTYECQVVKKDGYTYILEKNNGQGWRDGDFRGFAFKGDLPDEVCQNFLNKYDWDVEFQGKKSAIDKMNQLKIENVEVPVVEAVKVDDVEIISVEPAKVQDVEVVDMGDIPVLTGKFKNFSKQIDKATSLRELDQIENSIVVMNDSPQKKALLNKINQKRAEITNNNNQFVYEAQVDDGFDYQQQQRLQDDINNQFVADYMFHDQMDDDLFNMNNGFDGMF